MYSVKNLLRIKAVQEQGLKLTCVWAAAPWDLAELWGLFAQQQQLVFPSRAGTGHLTEKAISGTERRQLGVGPETKRPMGYKFRFLRKKFTLYCQQQIKQYFSCSCQLDSRACVLVRDNIYECKTKHNNYY